MRLLKPLALLFILITTEAADPDPRNNQFLFCKKPTPPVTTAETDLRLDSGECMTVYNINYKGCFVFPDGYGLENQSLITASPGLACTIYTDAACKKDGDGPRYQFAYLNRQFKTYKCKCAGKLENGICSPQ